MTSQIDVQSNANGRQAGTPRQPSGDLTMALNCEVRHIGDVSVLDLKGSLSLAERQGDGGVVIDCVRALIDSGKKKIILNFAGINYMDSAGVGQLIGTLTTTRSRGGQIKILKPSNEIRKLLELTQLSKVVEIHEDEDSAVRAYAA